MSISSSSSRSRSVVAARDLRTVVTCGSSSNGRFAAVMSWLSMQRRGTLVEDGEYAILTFRRTYRHSLAHVWEAIATPEGLREWLMCTHAMIDGRVGGRFELVSGPAGYRLTGKILGGGSSRGVEN